MAAGAYSFTIEKGATFDRQVTWYQDDAMTLPVNLTGWTARMRVADKAGVAVLDSQAVPATITLTLGGVAGTIDITVAALATAPLVAGARLVYDLLLVDAAGAVTRLLQGRVRVSAAVTP